MFVDYTSYDRIFTDHPVHQVMTPTCMNTIVNSKMTASHCIKIAIQKKGKAVHRMPSYGIRRKRKCREDEIAART